MNLLMNRRRLLKPLGGREWEKTIIYENYQPNKQAFSTDLSASDCDLRTDDTLFINIHLTSNTGDRFEIFQVGNDISTATDNNKPTVANTSIMEWRWMASSTSVQMQNRFGAYKYTFQSSSFNYTTLTTPSDYKIAFNKNGIIINGVDVTSRYAISNNNINWNDILTYLYTTENFQIGSVYKKTGQVEHSKMLINEASIIHGFLTVNEMITLTS